MVKKKQLFYLFYIFYCSFTLLVLAGKRIIFQGAGAAGKKIPRAGAAWEKNQEPEPLEKKVRRRSR